MCSSDLDVIDALDCALQRDPDVESITVAGNGEPTLHPGFAPIAEGIFKVRQRRAPGARLALLSSRMGSIGTRTSAAGWLYRASKAAANSVLKDAATALQGRATCVAFHPGWVQTDMGGPGATLPVERSVADMRRVIAGLVPADNGRFLDHDGSAIDW